MPVGPPRMAPIRPTPNTNMLSVADTPTTSSSVGTARTRIPPIRVPAQFEVANALYLGELGRAFDTIIDCGVFHTFDDAGRARSVGEIYRSFAERIDSEAQRFAGADAAAADKATDASSAVALRPNSSSIFEWHFLGLGNPCRPPSSTPAAS